MTVTMSLQHLPVALWVDSAGTEVVMQTILVTSEIVWSAHLDRAVAQASLVAQAERRMRANAPRSSSDDASDDDAGGTARVNKGNDGEYVPGLAERQAFQRVKTHIMANIRDLTNRITADVMVGASAHLRNVDAARNGVAPGTGTAASSPGHVRRGTIGVVPRRRTTVGASGTRVGGSGVGGNTFAPSLASIPARGKAPSNDVGAARWPASSRCKSFAGWGWVASRKPVAVVVPPHRRDRRAHSGSRVVRRCHHGRGQGVQGSLVSSSRVWRCGFGWRRRRTSSRS